MSWYLSVPATTREKFADAVDAAEVAGQSIDLPGVQEDVLTAKALLKMLVQRVKREFVSGQANGHTLQPSEHAEGQKYYDGLQIAVAGND